MKLVCCATTILVFCGGVASLAAERVCPKTIHNSYECAQFLEKELGKEYPTLFSRDGLKLMVKLIDGGEKTYIDSAHQNDDAKVTWYSFVQYYPEIGYGLIEVQFYEGGTRYLLNLRTGKDTDIVGDPILSPDKKRIAVSNVDIESRYTPNVLSVHEVRPNGLTTEFLEKPVDWGPGNLRWVTNQELLFIEYRFDPEPPYKERKTPKTLKYRGTDNKGVAGWSIEYELSGNR
ncbi:MAG: hypothetical protein A2151_09790 [Candidatus Muproteobacteria bacterium RBG_16_65_34]|uniref:Dipeptidylpeptidase IV N-terminal domain-containing protein n=1 Tax=Candidatus Muproteobacteria bacterium RBG_16_65_34 TaxID=1817760 RepID=A0A1F6TU38_9PROT|nr:MAG: hypothetical protein A2151_09790 [Candidatus Muproteobacteria bacterium RBG_16_65_34]